MGIGCTIRTSGHWVHYKNKWVWAYFRATGHGQPISNAGGLFRQHCIVLVEMVYLEHPEGEGEGS